MDLDYKGLSITLISMAVTVYLLRAVPMVAFKNKIDNKFIKSVLAYLPYAVIASMTFPGVIYCTGNPASAIVGFAVAIILSYFNRSLISVCISAIGSVFFVEMFIRHFYKN